MTKVTAIKRIVTVPEMIEAIKEHYNLNDTLLAINLNVSNQTVKAWKEGKKPRKDSYLALTELYKGINSEEQTTEVTEVTEEVQEITEEKKPYEISYPNDGQRVYYPNHFDGQIKKSIFNIDSDADKSLYEKGLMFDTKEEAEQFKREQTLIKKIKCWAKEQQGDSKFDLDEYITKYDIYYSGAEKKLKIFVARTVTEFKKLPYFKSYEIAQACIDEFGDEILEVFC